MNHKVTVEYCDHYSKWEWTYGCEWKWESVSGRNKWVVKEMDLVLEDGDSLQVKFDEELYEVVEVQRSKTWLRPVDKTLNARITIETKWLNSIRARIENGGQLVKGTLQWRKMIKQKIIDLMRTGLTVKEACRCCEVSVSTVSSWKKRDRGWADAMRKAKFSSQLARRAKRYALVLVGSSRLNPEKN